MAPRSFELREFFHLALLRHLGTRLSGRSWAVKGGICLRFFHRSPRLSQDMDLDVASGVRAETLRNSVDSILESRPFASSLLAEGITRLQATKPKQTGTTQRWKVALYMGSGEPLPTKVEFSRRQQTIAYEKGVPDAELLRRYKIPPFAAQYYGPAAMAAQKVAALAAESRYALRDLYDLHHLFSVVALKPGEVAGLVKPSELEKASDKVVRFSYGDFKEQVLPYLSAEMIDLYADSRAFDEMQEGVERALLEMLK